MKRFASILMILAVLFCVAACGAEETQENTTDPNTTSETTENEENAVDVSKFGTLVVGTDGSHAPYCYLDVETDELQGFEIDVMNEIAARTGLDIQLEVANWDGIFGMLDSGKITTIACSVEPNAERSEKYDFTEPYMHMDKGIAVMADDDSVQSFADLDGKTIGCRSGGNSVDILNQIMEENNISFEIVTYDGSGMEYDLSIGRLDGYLDNSISIATSIAEGEFDFALAPLGAISPSYCAYPFVKDGEYSAELIELINGAIEEMKEDGTLVELSMEWLHVDAITEVE